VPISIAVCDDEKIVCEQIKRMIHALNEDCAVNTYSSGTSLLAANKTYDIYFLDIQMSGINGVETAKKIRKAETHFESVIIFITALREYMESAFDVKAFHYLIKPVNEDKFKSVFSRAVYDCRKGKAGNEKFILIKNGNAHQKIFLHDILYIESQNKKVIIHGTDRVTESYSTLREIEKNMDDSFFRCHRCYLVNMRHVKRYTAAAVWVKNGDEILLAQKKYTEFVKAYMAFTKSGGLSPFPEKRRYDD